VDFVIRPTSELLKAFSHWAEWIDSCKRAGIPLKRIKGMVEMFMDQELDSVPPGYGTPVYFTLRTAWGH